MDSRYKVNQVKNYTSVLEDKGLWYLWANPNQTLLTSTLAFNRELHLDFTVFQVLQLGNLVR